MELDELFKFKIGQKVTHVAWRKLEEQDEDRKDQDSLVQILGYCGRMISGSKASYKGRAVFNANVCTKKRKLWFGDIDLDRDKSKLQKCADSLKTTIYVLREMDARFDNEKKPLLDKAVEVFEPKL